MNWLAIFIGGGLGSLCRYFFALQTKHWLGSFPLHTLFANFFASLLLGVMLAFFAESDTKSQTYHLIAVGFCGGFSTFSTFSAETYQLFQQGEMPLALLNIALSVGTCLLAIALGWSLVRWFS